MRQTRFGGLLVHGALAGALGAATMSVLRLLAQREGWSRAPRAIEVWTDDELGLPGSAHTETQHFAEQLRRLSYGSMAGAAYALARGRAGAEAKPSRAVALGALLWAFGTALLPAAKGARPSWREASREAFVNLAAHLLYGSVTVYVLEELERQTFTRRLQLVVAREFALPPPDHVRELPASLAASA